MCAFSIGLCIRYTIIDLAAQPWHSIYIIFSSNLFAELPHFVHMSQPPRQDILEIKFNIITHYVHAKYVRYVHRVHTFRELHFGYPLFTYLVILCI